MATPKMLFWVLTEHEADLACEEDNKRYYEEVSCIDERTGYTRAFVVYEEEDNGQK